MGEHSIFNVFKELSGVFLPPPYIEQQPMIRREGAGWLRTARIPVRPSAPLCGCNAVEATVETTSQKTSQKTSEPAFDAMADVTADVTADERYAFGSSATVGAFHFDLDMALRVPRRVRRGSTLWWP